MGFAISYPQGAGRPEQSTAIRLRRKPQERLILPLKSDRSQGSPQLGLTDDYPGVTAVLRALADASLLFLGALALQSGSDRISASLRVETDQQVKRVA